MYGVGGGIFLLLIVLYWQRTKLYTAYGHWLRSERPLQPTWEAAFVLSGKPLERALRATELWQWRATPIYVTGRLPIDNLIAGGCNVYTECEITAHMLREYCIPDSFIELACQGTSTYEEMLLIRQLCLEKGYRQILIVSSPFHGRRIRLLAQKHLTPANIRVQFAPARPLHFRLKSWWESEYGLLSAFEESVKILFYWQTGLV